MCTKLQVVTEQVQPTEHQQFSEVERGCNALGKRSLHHVTAQEAQQLHHACWACHLHCLAMLHQGAAACRLGPPSCQGQRPLACH